MSVSIAYGFTKLLPYDASYDDKMEFLKNMAAKEYVEGCYEVIEVLDDLGRNIGEPRLLLVNEGAITEQLPPYSKEDTDRMHACKHERQQISYDMWGVLDSIQVFVPYYEYHEPWTIDIAPKGKLKMASLSYGIDVAQSMMEEADEADERELWKQVQATFRGAYSHDLFVMAGD